MTSNFIDLTTDDGQSSTSGIAVDHRTKSIPEFRTDPVRAARFLQATGLIHVPAARTALSGPGSHGTQPGYAVSGSNRPAFRGDFSLATTKNMNTKVAQKIEPMPRMYQRPHAGTPVQRLANQTGRTQTSDIPNSSSMSTLGPGPGPIRSSPAAIHAARPYGRFGPFAEHRGGMSFVHGSFKRQRLEAQAAPPTILANKERARSENIARMKEHVRQQESAKLEARALKAKAKAEAKAAKQSRSENATRHGIPWSVEEDELLYDLRRRGLPWAKIPQHFQGRTLPSLQVRFSSKLSQRAKAEIADGSYAIDQPGDTNRATKELEGEGSIPPTSLSKIRSLKRRTISDDQGFHNSLNSRWQIVNEDDDSDHDTSDAETDDGQPFVVSKDARLLHFARCRELGATSSNGHSIEPDTVQLQNLVYESLGMTKYLDDASGDIATVAWSPNDHFFAGGGVVLMDESSMQYNRARNLLIGDDYGRIKELPEHHVRRPSVGAGVNSLASMRQTQDERLFTTVQMVGFSPDSQHLYSVSTDGKLNSYRVPRQHASEVQFEGTYAHQGPVDLLTIGQHGLVATACRSLQANSINIFKHDGSCVQLQRSLSSRSTGTKDGTYASALKWGVATHQSKWLLAGFGQEKQRLYAEDSDLDILGETCLFDGETGQRVDFGQPRNVFDVAWNPNLGYTAFAVASVGFGKLNHGMHTVIRVMREGQHGLRCAVELECPARDLNDIVYCPFDDNLVAAGSTDGKIYIWDIRSTRISPDPQMALSHGNCVSVLPHDRKRWEVDTGIRFLSWGANHSRLFSGSSDGVVKVWNPYVNNEDTHIADIATFQSAIMSGAFNSDHTELLIGEDQGRLNLLEVGAADIAIPERFSLLSAPEAKDAEPGPHKAMLEAGEIVFEKCGALPIRQALQGPEYKPPKNLVTESEAALYQKALRFQRELFHQRNRWKKLKKSVGDEDGSRITACELDCGYLPRGSGDGDEIPDSRRSADRIPDALKSEPLAGVKALMYGLVAKCSSCGAAARPAEKDGDAAFCERCSFACFRCGTKAVFSGTSDTVECDSCGITWSVGCTGYQILKQPVKKRIKTEMPAESASEDEYEFGDEERQHYLNSVLKL
ncbi:hypothetical protein ANO11243_040890 [Dothideomycetidae sp. 11243]|nr:hypothetical protein ANO11243_040890 [fungal sp. No.11243]